MAYKTEKELIRACIKGKRDAQYELYNLHKDKMLGICLRYTSNRAEAQDVLQDGFVKVFRDLYQYKPVSPLGAWMRRVMINTALENIRRKKKNLFSTVDIQDIADLHESDEDIYAQFGVKALLKMVQRLPEGYRLVFNMYAIEGYTHKEIAEELGISHHTSKSQLFKARKFLRKMLESKIIL